MGAEAVVHRVHGAIRGGGRGGAPEHAIHHAETHFLAFHIGGEIVTGFGCNSAHHESPKPARKSASIAPKIVQPCRRLPVIRPKV